MRVTSNLPGLNSGAGQQLVEQHARAGTPRPVHEVQIVAGQILQTQDAARVAARDHQTLRATGKADQLVEPRREQGFVGAFGQ